MFIGYPGFFLLFVKYDLNIYLINVFICAFSGAFSNMTRWISLMMPVVIDKTGRTRQALF